MSPENFVFRTAQEVDRDRVWPLVSNFADSYVASDVTFKTSFSELIDRPDTLVLVVAIDADIIGYLLASCHGTFFANGSVVWIEEVMVAKSFRDSGVGRSLMDRAEQRAAAFPAAYVSLASRRSGDFYRKLDYVDSATYLKKDLSATGS